MKSLFDSNHKYSQEAISLDTSISKVLREVFQQYTAQGYSPREIALIAYHAIQDVEFEVIESIFIDGTATESNVVAGFISEE